MFGRTTRVFSAIALSTTIAVTAYGTQASAQQGDATPITAENNLAPQAFGDWRDNIAPLYRTGWPIQVGTFDLGGGRMFTPTIMRIQRNGHSYGLFWLPNGHLFALSERDGIIYNVPDPNNTGAWTLAEEKTLAEDIAALWAIVSFLFWVFAFLAAGFMWIVGIIWILMIVMDIWRENQMSTGAWGDNTAGITWVWTTNARARGAIEGLHPSVPGILANYGIINIIQP